jgi:hypothetical protein
MIVAAGCTLRLSRAPAFMPGFFAFGGLRNSPAAPGGENGLRLDDREQTFDEEQARGIGGDEHDRAPDVNRGTPGLDVE